MLIYAWCFLCLAALRKQSPLLQIHEVACMCNKQSMTSSVTFGNMEYHWNSQLPQYIAV